MSALLLAALLLAGAQPPEVDAVAGAPTPADAGVVDDPPAADGGTADPAEVDASDEGAPGTERDEALSTARPPPAELVGKPLASVKVRLDEADEEEEAQLVRYLQDLQGRAVSTDLLVDAQDRLLRLGRFRAAVCRAGGTPQAPSITCSLTRARMIRDVVVRGLPTALLEKDLMKRVFLRRGEPLERKDASGKNRIPRQRERVEDYLVREGYWGAEVKILTPRAQDDGEVDVVVRIRGGSFVQVRDVRVERFGPLSQEELRRSFGDMCLTAAGLLDAAFVGTTSCFNRDRLRDTIERFEQQLVERGYPEGRVRVDVRTIDATNKRGLFDPCGFTDEEQAAFRKVGLAVPPRCVDLTVDVDQGPRLETDIVPATAPTTDAPEIVELPAFGGSWLLVAWENLFAPLSRIVNVVAGAWQKPTWDSMLIEEDLEEAYTFDEANAVDDTEAQLSAAALKERLGTRGYPLARVEPVRAEPAPDDVRVRFLVDPGPALWIRRVRFVGNDRVDDATILDEVELAARPRALQTSGFVSPTQLEDDEVRLRELYAAKGFPEAVVESEIVRTGAHTMEVVFRIEEGERFLVAGVELAGGDPSLAPAVLAALVHCRGPDPDEERVPRTRADCVGSPFLPDELEAEEQRVLNVYAEAGYAHVAADLETGFTEQGTLLRVTVRPTNGDALTRPVRARLGEIFVEGAVRTRRGVILRELGLDDAEYGDRLDPVRVAEGVSRLRRTGLYSRVQLDYLGLDDPDTDVAHVRVRVEERPAVTADASVGFSSERLASLRGEARHKNLLGTMLDVGALVDFGLFVGRWSEASTHVRWPRMLGTDLSSTWTVRATYEDAPAGLRKLVPPSPGPHRAFAAWHQPDDRRRELHAGFGFGVDWKLSDEVSAGVAYDFGREWNNLAAEPIEPFSQRALETLDGLLTAFDVVPVPVGAITPRVSWNTVDNPFDPESGFAVESFVRLASRYVGAATEFAVLGFGARGYWTTLQDRLTFAGNMRLRWGIVDSTNLPCPAYEPSCGWVVMQRDLLRLGGQRSIRGYPQDSIGPLSIPLDFAFRPLADAPAPRPGLFGAVVNLEARFLLLRNFFIGDVKPAVFVDAGATTDDVLFPAEIEGAPGASFYERFQQERRLGVSVGAGLRYVMPVGPASIDCAASPIHQVGGFPLAGCELLFGYVF